MLYTYQADLYCAACGDRIRAGLPLPPGADADDETTYDSDDYPKPFYGTNESDSIDHCASGVECLTAIDLGAFGLAPDAPLYGMESRLIGAALTDDLTSEGCVYIAGLIQEPARTPYQEALHQCWRDLYGDQLSSVLY